MYVQSCEKKQVCVSQHLFHFLKAQKTQGSRGELNHCMFSLVYTFLPSQIIVFLKAWNEHFWHFHDTDIYHDILFRYLWKISILAISSQLTI